MTTGPHPGGGESRVIEVDALVRRKEFELRVALTAAAGETLVVVGPNGSGKSTLLRLIAGLQPIEEGIVKLADVVCDEPERGVFVAPQSRGLGFVFQDARLFGRASVLANVGFGLRARGVSRVEAARRGRDWLERFEIADLSATRSDRLSGGQAQRVALARAFATEPAILLLDEPFSALDIATRTRTRSLLRALLRERIGVRLLVTHDPFEALAIADRIVVLEDGAVVQQGTVDEIRARPRSRYIAEFIGLNVLFGVVNAGLFVSNPGPELVVADIAMRGSAIATIAPNAISMHRTVPDTSARNCWPVVVVEIYDAGDARMRVVVDGPIPLTVEITAAAALSLELQQGTRCWVSVKATEIVISEL